MKKKYKPSDPLCLKKHSKKIMGVGKLALGVGVAGFMIQTAKGLRS